jgi:hypothetical protein
MEQYIKYKRIHEIYTDNDIQELFDLLITTGWEIIYYYESPNSIPHQLTGKALENELKKLGDTNKSDEIIVQKREVTVIIGKKQIA